jgi:hypothetical protein
VGLMILFLILSLFLLIRLKRVKHLPWCFLPLVIVQNEVWLSQAPSFWLGATLVLLNISWLVLLSAAVARKWPEWDDTTMDRLRRLKG